MEMLLCAKRASHEFSTPSPGWGVSFVRTEKVGLEGGKVVLSPAFEIFLYRFTKPIERIRLYVPNISVRSARIVAQLSECQRSCD